MQGKSFYKIAGFGLFLLTCYIISSTSNAETSSILYRKPIPSLPTTFDPKLYSDAYSVMVSSQIYDRLLETDEILSLKPKIAESWESLDGGQKWIVHLRNNVLFHNDKRLTADDVIFSLSRLFEKDSIRYNELSLVKGAKEYHNGSSKKVEGLKKIDDYTIEIDLIRPFPPFISIFAAPNTEILPAYFAGKSADKFFEAPIGSGAFKFEKIEADKSVTLAANDHYFHGRSKLDKIIFEKTSREEAIKGFNSGLYNDIEWFFPRLEEITRDYSVIKTPRASTSVIVFNTRHQPLNNINVRKAIAIALNKQTLLSQCYSDRIPANGFIPPGLGGYYANLPDIAENTNSIKSEFNKIKQKTAVFQKPLVLLRPDNYPCQEMFTKIMTEAFKKAGLQLNVIHLPLGKIVSQYYWARDYDLLHLTYPADFPEALFMLNMFRSDTQENPSGIKVPEIDKLLDQASSEPDRYKRYELYQRVQEIIQQNVPIIPLYYDVFSSIYQINVKNVKKTPLASYMAPMWSIEIVEDKK